MISKQNFILQLACLLAFTFTTSGLMAQHNSGTGSAAAPTCDLVLPKIKKDAQKEADASCSTVTVCTECIEKASKIKICAVQVVQPNCNGSAHLDDTVFEPKVEYKKDRFSVDILQSPCIDKGINLEVFIPGSDASARDTYTFLWEIDGKKAGHERVINCACGKSATVKVTNTKTGRVQTRSAKMNGCKTPSKD